MKAIFLILIIGVLGCTSAPKEKLNEVFAPQAVALNVADLEQSSLWYEKLGFANDTIMIFPEHSLKISILNNFGFKLELIEFDSSVNKSMLNNQDDTMPGGFFKLGFMVNNIDSIFTKLKSDSVDVLTDLNNLPPTEVDMDWPERFFLAADPDGNLIQFFSQEPNEEFTKPMVPFLVGIAVSSLDTIKKWYIEKLGFRALITVGESGNKRAILERNQFVIELYEPTQTIDPSQFLENGVELQRISKLGFISNRLDSLKANFKETDFLVPLSESNMKWASHYFIVLDSEKNPIQVFSN